MNRAPSLALAALVLAAVLVAGKQFGITTATTAERKQELLDPAQVELIRTPGGFLQVGAMDKVEEFAWQTAWKCPVVDCSGLPRTISRIRVKAHYVWRIPLAAEWRLEPAGDHYRLTVPPPQLERPVAFDTESMDIVTTESSVFSPASAPNRENLVRHLGPELARRGAGAPYFDAQQKQAEQTVREFAQKWMLEQGRKIERPIRVEFRGPDPS